MFYFKKYTAKPNQLKFTEVKDKIVEDKNQKMIQNAF